MNGHFVLGRAIEAPHTCVAALPAVNDLDRERAAHILKNAARPYNAAYNGFEVFERDDRSETTLTSGKKSSAPLRGTAAGESAISLVSSPVAT